MIYILDAYNVIHATPEFERKLDLDLKAARDALISFCLEAVSRRGDIREIYLVFDGKSEVGDFKEGGPAVKVIYSETGEDADDRIVSLLEELKNPRFTIVVSNDNYVTNTARAYRVRPMKAEAFMSFARGVSKRPPAMKENEEPGTDESREITEEYRRFLGID